MAKSYFLGFWNIKCYIMGIGKMKNADILELGAVENETDWNLGVPVEYTGTFQRIVFKISLCSFKARFG